MTDVLLCVGNSMMGDDGAGPLLAQMCAAHPQGEWVVIDGGSAPENDPRLNEIVANLNQVVEEARIR